MIHCYILNTFWYNNVFSHSALSGPIEPPKFNQGLKSFNKDISRTVGQILKIRPPSILQIQFSITFILCKFTIFLLLRVLNYKKTIFGQSSGKYGSNFLRISRSFYESLRQIQFSITFILCKYTVFLLFRVLIAKKKLFLDDSRPRQIRIQIVLLSLTFKDLQILLWIT